MKDEFISLHLNDLLRTIRTQVIYMYVYIYITKKKKKT